MRIFFIFLLSIFFFIFGTSFGHYKYTPFKQIVNAKNYIISFIPKNLVKFSSCNIPEKFEVLNNTHAFIGHAYGSPNKSKFDSYLAKNAEDFINKNKLLLRTIIFTGDVFSFPSLDKWKRLSNETNDNLEIYIAPGNHDVQRPDSIDIFELSEFGRQTYPFLKYLDETPIIFEDSANSGWKVSNQTLELANNIESTEVIIARHNIPISDLLNISNSYSGISTDLEKIEILVKKFKYDKSFYWIIGDSGAFSHLPRISCLIFKNHTFIINGLGQVSGDSVILYNKGKFYRYEISPIID